MKVDRRHTIILKNKTSTQNLIGDRDPYYVQIRTMKAAYIPKGGSMYMGAAEVHTETDAVFNVIYPMSGVVPESDMYVFFNGQIFLILSCIDLNGLHREMNILCKREK